jgi:CMP/dCMP kinase
MPGPYFPIREYTPGSSDNKWGLCFRQFAYILVSMSVIRVSGYPGSGKTTLCKRLAEELGYEYHYAGKIFRDMANERGQSIEEFYASLSAEPELEKSVDEKLGALMQKQDNLVMEGRVLPFLPSPFKTVNILLTVDEHEGARRALERPENAGRTLEDMAHQTAGRLSTERKRFQDLYGIEDHLDPKHFDIALDTTGLTPDGTFQTIAGRLRAA